MILSRRELVFVLSGFILLAVVFAWPLPTQIERLIPTNGVPADPMHLLYGLISGTQTLSENPFRYFDATIFYPYQSTLAFLDHMFALALITAPVVWSTGNIFLGYNVTWLMTFALSGLGAYLLARYLTGSMLAAWLAGILYAFHPFRFANAGRIDVLAVMWIPFALLSVHLWVETRRRRMLFLALAFSLAQFLSSGQSGVLLLVALLLYFGVLLVTDRKETVALVRAQSWVVASVLVLGAAMILPFALPYLTHSASDTAFQPSLAATAPFSAKGVDFVTPAPSRFLPGWTGSEQARHFLFPGILILVCAGVWIVRRGWKDHGYRPEMIFYLSLAVLGAVLALGPETWVGGKRIPLPFSAVYYALPGASLLHAPVRFYFLALLGLGIVGGAGLASLLDLKHRTRRVLWSLVPALAAVELMSVPISLLDPLPLGIPKVYAWLGSVDGNLAIVELPMPENEAAEKEEHARYQLYSLVHRKRMVNGVASLVPPLTRDTRRQMQHFPDNSSVPLLQSLGVTYVLVHAYLYPPEVVPQLRAAVDSHPGLVLIQNDDDIWLLDVIPGSAIHSSALNLDSKP